MSQKRNLDEMLSSDESVPDLVECSSCSSDEVHVCKKFKGLPEKQHLADDDSTETMSDTVAYGFSDDEYFQQIYAEEDARIAQGSDDDSPPHLEYDPEFAEANLPNIPLWPGDDDSENDPMQMPLDPPEYDFNNNDSWSATDDEEDIAPSQAVHAVSDAESEGACHSPLYQNQLEDPRVQALQDKMFNGNEIYLIKG